MYRKTNKMNLLHYIQGFRKGKEAHRIEREAMQDPFLADAIDGFDNVKGKHTDSIKNLQSQVNNHSQKKSNYGKITSIAAGFLLCIGIGSYFLFDHQKLPENLYTEYIQEEKKADSVQTEEIITMNFQEASKKEIENTTNKTLLSTPMQVSSIAPSPSVDAEIASDLTTHHTEVIEKSNVTSFRTMVQQPPSQVIKENKLMSEATAVVNKPAGFTIRGKVTNEKGEPLIGASVIQKNVTSSGSVTNTDGYFELHIDTPKDISIQYIGYDPVSIFADTSQLMLVAMHENKQLLHETITVGYAKAKKKDSSIIEIKKVNTPQPVIGKKAFKKYLANNLIPPTDEECKGIKGKITVFFHVNEKGRPYDIYTKKSLCTTADKEAIRLIEQGPDWTLGEKEISVDIVFK